MRPLSWFLIIMTPLLALAPSVVQAKSAEPTGAAEVWASDDPAALEIREMIRLGDHAGARSRLADERLSTEFRDSTLEILRRIERDYSRSPREMLEVLARHIPDVSEADLQRWTEARQIQHRVIDGQTRYFRREPSNLWRFCDEAKSRRKSPATAPEEFELVPHLEEVLRATGEDPLVLPRRQEVTYTLTVPAKTPGMKSGSVLRVWLPFPQEYRTQRNIRVLDLSPPGGKISPTWREGESGHEHRCVYFEHRVDDPTVDAVFSVRFAYDTGAWSPRLDSDLARPLPADWGEKYLTPRPPHLVLSPELRELAAKIVGNETNPLQTARRIFEFVSENVRYNAEEEYSIIPSLSEHALKRMRGDCGVQTMLFIGLCRAAGVPARWQSGWTTTPVDWNMHDWAEFYVEPWGWLPADVSFGPQKSDDPEVRWFYFGRQDAYRWIVNMDWGRDLTPPTGALRSEPADFQRGEVELDGKNLYFDAWKWNVKF
jgi:transglutaminase-like putative cysteine protease